nr:AAA family ATPase [Paenarthrobacter ureafaciens]
MIEGIMKMDFNPFRAVPFRVATLEFNTGESLRVSKAKGVLRVAFQGVEVELHPDHGGPREESSSAQVAEFRTRFELATRSINFEFLGDARSAFDNSTSDLDSADLDRSFLEYQRLLRSRDKRAGKDELSKKVQNFVRNAQLDSKTFFRSGEPELFDRIINDLTSPQRLDMTPESIREQLFIVREMEKQQIGFDLRIDEWDLDRLSRLLEESNQHTLSVIGTYAELLRSRADSRQFVVDRLLTFESVMADFLHDKSVKVTGKGLTITSDSGRVLKEGQLSSGEYQLLYLMVAALTTRRRGTVIAMDEPELSMHVEWQRKLVPSLIRCASRANPQFLFATHSPDVAASYFEKLVVIGRGAPGAAAIS